MHYQNFDLEIISTQGGERLSARVLDSPQGDCPFADIKWPFTPEQESEMLREIYGGLRQRRARIGKPNTIEDFGGKLFDAIFTGDIEHLFRSSLDIAGRNGKGLRIVLRLPENSDLHARPWEYLFDTESREFMAVREHTPLVRYLPVAQPIPPMAVEGPLRVLVALSSPTDHPRLDIAREWDILWYALEPAINAGHIELRRVPGRCTFDHLRDSLRNYGADIFHFVGHGVPGALVLEQESGKGLEMEATHLRAVFSRGALPRLIVLNACSGAQAEDAPLSGLAQGFLRQGVPAVVAMQASITDEAALIFTRYFYHDLVATGAVDASLTEARLRMQGGGNLEEWGTPVLYMRAPNGQLFQPRGFQNEHGHRTEPPPVHVPPAGTNGRREPPAGLSPLPPDDGAYRDKPPHGRGHGGHPGVEPTLAPEPVKPSQPPKPPEPVSPDVTWTTGGKKPTPPPGTGPAGREPSGAWGDEPAEMVAAPPEPPGARKPEGRRVLPAQWLTAGLLALVLMLTFGAYKLFSARDRTPVADNTAATATALPATSKPASGAATTGKAAPAETDTTADKVAGKAADTATDTAAPQRTDPGPSAQPAPRQEVSKKTAPPKHSDRVTAKVKPVPKRLPAPAEPAPAPDKCQDADVSKRSVECLFR